MMNFINFVLLFFFHLVFIDENSATEGADSGPESQPGTPLEGDQAGQIGHVTAKVSQSAKTFGSFLYSAVNKAGAKIKKTVEDNVSIYFSFDNNICILISYGLLAISCAIVL